MTKIPKYKAIELVFTASQYNGPSNSLWLPYYDGKGSFASRSTSSLVYEGDYILTDQFNRQWHIGRETFKDAFQEVD
jgi:hypothetical protein